MTWTYLHLTLIDSDFNYVIHKTASYNWYILQVENIGQTNNWERLNLTHCDFNMSDINVLSRLQEPQFQPNKKRARDNLRYFALSTKSSFTKLNKSRSITKLLFVDPTGWLWWEINSSAEEIFVNVHALYSHTRLLMEPEFRNQKKWVDCFQGSLGVN